MGYLLVALNFLIHAIFSFAIGVFVVRAIFIAVNAPFYEPLCQAVYKLTNPLVTPLRGIVKRWGKVDLASLLVAVVLALAESGLTDLLFGRPLNLGGWVLESIVNVLQIAVWIMLWAVIIRCIVSFFVSFGGQSNSNTRLLIQFTEPVVAPFRRLLPSLAGLDFSCWVACIALTLVQILILAPLNDLALRL